MSEEDTSTSQSTAEEIVGSKQRRSILRVAQRNVDKDGLHDDKHSGAVDGDANCGHDPVNGGARSPGEQEQTNGRTKGSGQSRDKAVFLDGETEAGNARVDEEVQVGSVHADANQTRDQNAQEDEADLT